ncbi:MAG: HupE/UreJ family protein [Deltaproteobacteria bacterium]|nr:HupE/UreJ family protein [Deltaproteobacteria bacterium]
MSPSRAGLALVLLSLGLLAPERAVAHGLEPALLALRETQPGRFDVVWRSSALRLPGATVAPRLPERCREITSPTVLDEGDRLRVTWAVDCGADGLVGARIGVDDLAPAAITALLRIEPRSGRTVEAVLTARAPTYVVPASPSAWQVWRDEVALGVEHILSGPDHVLFILGLLLLVSSWRQLVQTITAFTLGHSITLSLAALQIAAPPPRPTELLIALSVLLLAVELARGPHAGSTLRRFPWAMAIAFGLLHGFGFAGALVDAGLPRGDVPLALLGFNLGIEAGQLALVGTALLAAALVTRRVPRLATWGRLPAVYTIGILAAFWCFQRAALWLG